MIYRLSLEEYRIAQLYMIQKKSKEESTGEGSGQSRNASHVHIKTRALLLGVEILKNEPYTNGPNGTDGQYTEKLYHVQSHLPGWVSSFLSKGIFLRFNLNFNIVEIRGLRCQRVLVECVSIYEDQVYHFEF